MNRVALSGRVVELGQLRFTPSGIPVVEFILEHQSEQEEAGGRRQVQAEVSAIAFESQARLIAGAALGAGLRLEGFLSAKSKRSKKIVLHVTNTEFIEGEKDAPATQR